MSGRNARSVRRTWPIAYGHRRRASPAGSASLAWALFLGLGLPMAFMGALTTLARAGIYVDLFRPLWQPFPPDLLKPFIGVAGFAATLAYLMYCVGQRSGYRIGMGARLASLRYGTEGRPREAGPPFAGLPPPPPPDDGAFRRRPVPPPPAD